MVKKDQTTNDNMHCVLLKNTLYLSTLIRESLPKLRKLSIILENMKFELIYGCKEVPSTSLSWSECAIIVSGVDKVLKGTLTHGFGLCP